MIDKILKQSILNSVPVILKDTTKILSEFLLEKKPKTILEIGSGIGYSGAVMLTAAGESSHLTTIEKDEARFEMLKENLETFNAQCILGDAIDYLKTTNKKFDFIFLDGPKGQYINYLPYLKKLLNMGGTLFADNVYFHGFVTSKEEKSRGCRTMVNNLKKFITAITTDKDFETKLLDDGDGIIIAKLV